MGPAQFSEIKIFPPGKVWGRSAARVNLGPCHVSETIGARKLTFYTRLEKAKGRVGGAAPLL